MRCLVSGLLSLATNYSLSKSLCHTHLGIVCRHLLKVQICGVAFSTIFDDVALNSRSKYQAITLKLLIHIIDMFTKRCIIQSKARKKGHHMYSFLVLGLIPGTNIQLSFQAWLGLMLVLIVCARVFRAQISQAWHNLIDVPPDVGLDASQLHIRQLPSAR